MTERRPVRQTTAALIKRATQDYHSSLQSIANMAVEDGEAPSGSNLDTTSLPATWVVAVPDAEPSRELKLEKQEEA